MGAVNMALLDSAITEMVQINEVLEELKAGYAADAAGYAAGALTIEGLEMELSRAIKRVNAVMKGAAEREDDEVWDRAPWGTG
jgi:hypothetical protein